MDFGDGELVWEFVRGVAGGLLATLGLALSHWFPRARPISRLEAYAWGTGLIWLGFATWRLSGGDWVTPLGLLVIDVAGGLVVIGVYRLDGLVQRLRQAAMAEHGDDELAGAQ